METTHTDGSSNRELRQHWLTVFSLLYLAVPCMLFFSSWFIPAVAWPVNLGICVFIWRYSCKGAASERWSPTIKDIVILLVMAVACLVSVLYAGVAGYVETHYDILVYREALFCNLLSAPWPLVLPNGQEMSYYLAGSLPAAMLGRLTENYAVQHFIAALWGALGLFLTMLLYCCRYKKTSVLFVFFLLFISDPAYLIINCFSGSGDVWQLLSRFIDLPDNTYVGTRSAIMNLMGSGQTYTFVPYTLVAGALLITTRAHMLWLAPLCIALLVSTSPLGAIGCLPLGAYLWMFQAKGTLLRRFLSMVLPLGIALPCAVYFFRGEGDTCFGLFGNLMQNWHYFFTSYYASSLLGGLLFLVLLFRQLKSDRLLAISLLSLFIIPFFYFGSTPESRIFGNNELWLKTSPIYHTHLIAVMCFNWRRLNHVKYIFLLASLVLNGYELAQKGIRFTHTPVVQDVWNGHLYHRHPSLYQKIPHCRDSFFPALFLKNGEAESCFPGNLLPKAPGCDYSRPANWDILPHNLRV